MWNHKGKMFCSQLPQPKLFGQGCLFGYIHWFSWRSLCCNFSSMQWVTPVPSPLSIGNIGRPFITLWVRLVFTGWVDSDIILFVWVPCVLAWMFHNEGTINDIKVVGIKHKKIVRLHCHILLDESLIEKVISFGVIKMVTLITNKCESC